MLVAYVPTSFIKKSVLSRRNDASIDVSLTFSPVYFCC